MINGSDGSPHLWDKLFVTYTGMETDLIFTQGVELPGFASYPLLETETGRDTLRRYYRKLIRMGRSRSVGVILESTTWVANRDRGAAIGYNPETLRRRNSEAIALMAETRRAEAYGPVILSANLGPRDDAYAPSNQMNIAEAREYHAEQISVLAGTKADILTAYTLAYSNEAIGIARAADDMDMPCVISFTVETDGRLPSGETLAHAVKAVEKATDHSPAYYMINCAHPSHFAHVLRSEPWAQRIHGLVVNASRRSHAELDCATELDAGDRDALAAEVASLLVAHPNVTVIGGCCGTDLGHIEAMLDAVGMQELPREQTDWQGADLRI